MVMGKDGKDNLQLLIRIKRSDRSDFNILRYYLNMVRIFYEKVSTRLYKIGHLPLPKETNRM